MKHLQGKVISISVKEVTEGMQVLTQYGICTVRAFKDNIVWILMLGNKNPLSFKDACLGYDYTLLVTELKTLVVEYSIKCPNKECYYGEIEDNGPKACPTCGSNEVVDLQLPLKYSQWQLVIDNGEVDSNKVVEFEIIDSVWKDTQEGKDTLVPKFQYAKIIPQKKRMYSDEEVVLKIYSYHNWLSSKDRSKWATTVEWIDDNIGKNIEIKI